MTTKAKTIKKAVPHTEVEVTWLPQCDFCAKDAAYDARTGFGSWANLCESHFRVYGVGLGLGKGQKLILTKGATT